MVQITTVKIFNVTKGRLDKLKEHPRESYEHVLRKILHILNMCKKDPERAQKILKRIDILNKRKASIENQLSKE